MNLVSKLLRCSSTLLITCLIAMILASAACGSNSDSNSSLKALPVYEIGDTWTTRQSSNGNEGAITYAITGEEISGKNEVYVLEMSFEPSLVAIVDTIIVKVDKSNMLPLETEVYSDFKAHQIFTLADFSYEISGAPYYPKEVGNETTVVRNETSTNFTSEEMRLRKNTTTSIYRIEQVEEVTVPAGTFTCFKEVEYDEAGTLISVNWQPVDGKLPFVKTIDYETSDTEELVSHSIN